MQGGLGLLKDATHARKYKYNNYNIVVHIPISVVNEQSSSDQNVIFSNAQQRTSMRAFPSTQVHTTFLHSWLVRWAGPN